MIAFLHMALLGLGCMAAALICCVALMRLITWATARWLDLGAGQ